MPEVPSEKTKPSKKRKGKEPIQEKSEIEVLQEQLRESRQEVINSKLAFEEWQRELSKQIDFYDKTVEKSKKMMKRTLPLHKMLKHMYKRNSLLQANMNKLQRQVKALETQIEMIKAEILKRNLKTFSVVDDTP